MRHHVGIDSSTTGADAAGAGQEGPPVWVIEVMP